MSEWQPPLSPGLEWNEVETNKCLFIAPLRISSLPAKNRLKTLAQKYCYVISYGVCLCRPNLFTVNYNWAEEPLVTSYC